MRLFLRQKFAGSVILFKAKTHVMRLYT